MPDISWDGTAAGRDRLEIVVKTTEQLVARARTGFISGGTGEAAIKQALDAGGIIPERRDQYIADWTVLRGIETRRPTRSQQGLPPLPRAAGGGRTTLAQRVAAQAQQSAISAANAEAAIRALQVAPAPAPAPAPPAPARAPTLEQVEALVQTEPLAQVTPAPVPAPAQEDYPPSGRRV